MATWWKIVFQLFPIRTASVVANKMNTVAKNWRGHFEGDMVDRGNSFATGLHRTTDLIRLSGRECWLRRQ